MMRNVGKYGNRDYKRFVETVQDAVRRTGENKDLTLVVASKGSERVSTHTRQEELTHRGDTRIAADSPYSMSISPFIGADGYSEAQAKLRMQGYPDSVLHKEVVGKLNRDNAAEELGISQKQVDILAEIRDNQLRNSGVTEERYKAEFGRISKQSAVRSERYGQAFKTRQQDRGRDIRDDESLRAGETGANSDRGRRTGQGSDAGRSATLPRTADRPNLARLRQADLSGRSGEGPQSLISPKERDWIERRSKGNTALAKAVTDEILFARAEDDDRRTGPGKTMFLRHPFPSRTAFYRSWFCPVCTGKLPNAK